MLRDIFKQQKQFSQKWSENLPHLKSQLKHLRDVLIASEQEIYAALKSDLNKSPAETYLTEYQLAVSEVNWFIRHFDQIYRHRNFFDPLWMVGHRSTLMREPYGVMAIYAPYNYPFNLSMVPLIGAIACSNTVILKPSKITPAINRVMKKIVEQCFPPEQCYVLSQEENESPNLYQELYSYDFDIVFFTGSEAIGREIYKVYADKLIPVVLELGGKSPAIIQRGADLELAAKRIIWGKTMNNGQTCVAPDYVVVSESDAPVLIEKMKLELKSQFPGQNVDLIAHMSSQRADAKIKQLIKEAKIIFQHDFNAEQHFWIVDGSDLSSPVMNQEIFGPILPIVTYKNDAEILSIVNHHENPLAMYVFPRDKTFLKWISKNLKSGAIVVNDLLIHLTKHTPFGGIKESGVGQYHKEFSVMTMMHRKPIIYSSKLDIGARYQPYDTKKLSFLKKFVK